MLKKVAIILSLSALAVTIHAQKIFTKEAKFSFNSKAPLETIEANNNSGVSVINLSDGQIEFSVLIKAFQFEKALMQEPFNENYMESSKYPKAIFKGLIHVTHHGSYALILAVVTAGLVFKVGIFEGLLASMIIHGLIHYLVYTNHDHMPAKQVIKRYFNSLKSDNSNLQ